MNVTASARMTVTNKCGLIHLLSCRYVAPMETLVIHIGLVEPLGDMYASGHVRSRRSGLIT